MAGRPVQLTNNTRMSRRTALTNYFDYDDERLMFEHLESFPTPAPAPPASASSVNYSRSHGPPAAPPRPPGVFELLQSKFGFQRASVANQKENFACWIANYQIRVDAEGGGDLYAALWRVHGKFLKNYRKWCKFLGTTAHVAPDGAPSHLLEKQIALFLCVWGEAANVRFMPECICFLYHTMADKLTGVETLPDVPEGYYLEHTVRPIYEVIAKMRTAASSADAAKLVDHQDITNYDDLNEFFWTPACLDYDEHNVAEALKVQDPKTFKEKRSVFNPVLAFFRVWFFLLLVFHILVVFAYVGYYTKNEGAQGWAYYAHWFDSAHSDRRNHALLSVLLTVSVLFTFKVILQIWLYGMRLFKDVWLTLGVLCRLFWHACFFAIFLLVNVSPSEPCFIKFGSLGKSSDGSAATYLSVGGYMALFYCIPILLASSVRMFCAQGIWSVRFLNSLDGTRRQYIGRDMSQPWRWFLLYGATWSTIFFLKFLFALELMIRPLVGPTIQVYETAISSTNGIVESNHNLLFITALWAPVIVVYLYDTQIWFILYQSIIGLYVGLKRKMGHYATMETMKTALYTAPEQFDKTVASLRAQAQRVTTQSDPEKSRDESLRLRFAIIWNEIISSFRLNDLLDDRETVILQYRILGHGRNVENPIFLFAGMVIKAVDIATKARPNAWSTAELTARLEKAGVLDGAMDAARLASEVFHLLFGASEDEGPLSVLERIYSSTDIVTLLDFQYLPTLVENVVDLLSAILDLPDDLSTVEREEPEFEEARVAFQEQTRLVVDKVTLTFNTIELMFGNDASVHEKLRRCKFTKLTTMLSFQKQQLLSLYKADAIADSSVLSSSTSRGSSRGSDASFDSAASTKYSREDFVGSCTRLFFLLRLDVAQSYPRCQDARRRLTFFLHTLNMDMPKVPSVEAMPSFSVMTPYYSETVLFTLNELKNPVNSNPLFERIDGHNREKGRDNLTIMGYLITFHAEEWCNFLERMGVNTLEEAIEHYPRQVRLWASLRGQTLARTVYGMMMYEDALRLLRWLELWNKEDLQEVEKVSEMNYISALKFSYITGCQIYSQQVEKGDPRAEDIDFLMKRFPSWRVSFVDAVKDENGTVQRYDCVLVKSEGEEIVEVYRYELPGNPILGEGKPENQNVALPFTRGEYLQTIDMNQEHYFEETLKMPNFLATAAASGEDVTIIGMKEHVFTGRASSLARFMTLQELVFVTLTQRVLAEPLRARMHYGHPDVFEKSFVMTNGGVSKASKGINLSEDVFSGYNVTLRGGLVTHVEFMQCGKGRDVTLNQINAFEAKLSNGCAESCLSREGHRMSNSLDFFRLNSMYYGHFGFYICNAMTVLCVYIYAYSKLYVATHNDVIETAATSTKELDSLAKVMTTQYILQFGLLTTLPLLSTLIVEFGWKQAVFQVMELVSALGVVFYVFLTGTKAHYYDVALIRGGSKYRATGRGFAITRDTMVNFFKDYGVSHFRKAVELIGVMILYGVYGNFSIGVGARDEFCASASFDCDEFPSLIPVNVTTLEAFGATPQSYGVASFAVLLLGACWLMAPFLFNTDGLVLEKTKIDVSHWFAWMMRVKCDDELIDDSSSEGTPKDGWIDWYNEDVNLMTKVGPMGRVTYCLRELRHPFAMYFVFATHFSNGQWPLLICAVLLTWAALWVGGYVALQSVGRNQKQLALSVRGLLYMVLVLGSITVFPVVIGKLLGWSALKGFTLSVAIFIGLNAICQYALAFHGAFGFPLASWSPFVALGFLHDMMVGVFLVVPLVVLSFLPFMRILQTRMMFNGGFARALSTGSEVAASICILVGVTGGYIYGFMSCFILNLGFVNAPKYHYISRSFLFYVTTELNNKGAINMPQWLVNGQLKALCSIIAVLAVGSSYLVGRVLGRRACMGIGAGLITCGLGLNFVDDGVVIVVASCFISAGSVFLAANYALYSYEICTKGWRGKGLTMFLLGSTVGFVVNASVHNKLNQTTFNQDFKNRPANNWRTLPMVAVLPILVVFMVALRYIPESPVWFMTQGDAVKCKATYVRLRRRQDVSYDMKTLEQQIYERKGTRNIPFRVAFVFTLQSVLSMLMSGGLLKRTVVKETTTSDGIRNSSELVYFGVCSAIGLSLSVFLIDNVRRKTILKDFLPFLAAVCIITASVNTAVVGKDGVIEGFVYVIVVATGLSFQSVAVLCSLEMFGAANRALFYSLSLGMFYAVQGLMFYFSPSFSLCHFLFGASCLALTLLMFGLCASTKEKAIQLKSEKKKQKEEAAAAAAAANANGNGSPAAMEQRPSLVAEAMQRQASRQQIRIAQASTAMAPPHNAYIGQSHLSSVPSSGTHNSNMSGSVVDLHALQRTGLGNLTSIAQSDSFRSSSDNGSVQLAALRRRQLGHASSELSSYSRLSSLHADDLDLEAEFDLLFNEVTNPVDQSRSQSFLESREFPDSEVRAETRGYGLRL